MLFEWSRGIHAIETYLLHLARNSLYLIKRIYLVSFATKSKLQNI